MVVLGPVFQDDDDDGDDDNDMMTRREASLDLSLTMHQALF